MEFTFMCADKQKSFNSNQFTIIDNKGIKTDASGNKVLDAKVILKEPCPFCGEKHIYHAKDLSCPFVVRSESEK
jgi:hypothetical protein